MRAAVITSTIGRPELRACIESVRQQAHKCDHYVFVNGARHWDKARAILSDFPGVHAFYIPDDTGDYGAGGSMADVFAAAPFLTRADFVFYLDDDNFFDADHVASLLSLAAAHGLEWAYSLRRIVDKQGTPICDDDWCSLGHYSRPEIGPALVDNSCFAVSRRLAQRMALAWTAAPVVADRCFFMALKESGARAGCTGLSSVNYRIGTGTAQDGRDAYLRSAESVRSQMPAGGFPWRKAQVF